MPQHRELNPRFQSHIARARRTRRIAATILGLCLLATSAAALGRTSLAQLPAHLAQPLAAMKLQLPSDATTQLAAAATSFPGYVAENVRNLFCRWLGCETASVAKSAQQPPESPQTYPTTLPQNVKPPASNQPPIGGVARSATTTSVVVSIASPSPSPRASNSPPQPIITQPVIERTIEKTAVQGGIDQAFLDARLTALSSDLTSRMNSLSNANSAQTTNVYNTVAQALQVEGRSTGRRSPTRHSAADYPSPITERPRLRTVSISLTAASP